MDLGIAQTFSDAIWMNIDIWHIEFTFAHGIILQMALHMMGINLISEVPYDIQYSNF